MKERVMAAKQTTAKDIVDQIKKLAENFELYQRSSADIPTYIPVSEMAIVIKQARKEQNVSREVLAKLAGISIGTLGAIETGKATVSLSNVQKVLQALGKSLWIR